jgi:hypothetical protein
MKTEDKEKLQAARISKIVANIFLYFVLAELVWIFFAGVAHMLGKLEDMMNLSRSGEDILFGVFVWLNIFVIAALNKLSEDL